MAWVQQHEQELLHPKSPVLPAFAETPAPLPSPPPDPRLISNPIPGVNYGTAFVKPAVVFGAINLPQPLNPIPGVDYGPPQLPAPPPLTPEAGGNEARFMAQQAANPSNIAHIQPQVPRSVDTESQPAPATRTRVVLV